MLTETQIERLAGMTAKLRPEWTARSVKTYIATKHADRAYRDLAVALAFIATDPTADTPARLEQHGPWWAATRFNVGGFAEVPPVGPGRGVARCQRPGHEHEPQHACRACRAETLAGTQPLTPPGPPVPASVDLLDALRRSLQRARNARQDGAA